MSEGPSPTLLGLIPARSGSERVPSKNIRPLGGHPAIAYTIRAARDSGVCQRVIVSTDCEEIAAIARDYGAEVPFLRPAEFAGKTSPDIEWLRHLLATLRERDELTDCFSILRPTSPFRTAETIRRAWQTFLAGQPADSLRAVEKCGQHPGKMWVIEAGEKRMRPLLTNGPKNPPWHSTPYQALPPVYVQNASLEIAWCRVVLEKNSIAGDELIPFLTEGTEGYDINTMEDWWVAERLLEEGHATLTGLS